MIKITKLDLFIIFIILAYVYFSLNTPKYLQSKGDELFAAVMTYRSLIERGYGVKVEVAGITKDYKFEKVSGIILAASPTRFYLWDGNKTWLVYDKAEFIRLTEEPKIPYLRPSIITLYPTESYRLKLTKECKTNSFVHEIVYLTLNDTTNSVLCDYISRSIWRKYGGEVDCSFGGNYLKLEFNFLHDFDEKYTSKILSDLGYRIKEKIIVQKDCWVLE